MIELLACGLRHFLVLCHKKRVHTFSPFDFLDRESLPTYFWQAIITKKHTHSKMIFVLSAAAIFYIAQKFDLKKCKLRQAELCKDDLEYPQPDLMLN